MSIITCECCCEVKLSYYKKHLLTMKHTTLLNSIEKKQVSGDLICESDLAKFTNDDIIVSIQRFMTKKGGYMANLHLIRINGLIKVINEYKIPLEDITKIDKPTPMIFTINEMYVSSSHNSNLYNSAYQVVSVTKCFVKFREIHFTGLDFQHKYPAQYEFKNDEIITKKIDSRISIDYDSIVLWKSGMTYDRTQYEFTNNK